MNRTGSCSSWVVCALRKRPVYLPWFVMFVDLGVEHISFMTHSSTIA